MRLKTLIATGLLLLALPVMAQDVNPNTVAFNGISFSFDSSLGSNVSISRYPGDPTDLEQPGGPEVAHTQFVLYNLFTDAGTVPSAFDAQAVVRVYRTADFAGYEFPSQQLQQLQTMLADRPDLATFMTYSLDQEGPLLPFMPVFPASQVIRAQAHYIDTPQVNGVAYVTVYRQDASPFVANEFRYTFQGLSADGQNYVSLVGMVNASLFPAELESVNLDDFMATIGDYMTQSIDTLNTAAPETFTPQLAAYDALVMSLNLPGSVTPPEVPAPTLPPAADVTPIPAPTLPPPPVEQTPEPPTDAGPLTGTWRLVSYGDPAAPVSVVENSTVTITFAPQGVSGNAGCNQFSGSFQFQNNTITFSPLVSTLMLCVDTPVMDQETAFLAALETASTYQIDGSTLTITYEGGVLTFERSA